MISVILPSRSRAHKAKSVLSDWIVKALAEVEVIVSVDASDPQAHQYLPFEDIFPRTQVLVGDNSNAVQAINAAATEATGDIIMVISDDFSCQDNWVRKIEKAVQGKRDYLLKTFDGIQTYIVTLPIMDRAYYDRFGYIYHPSYQHMFADTEITHVADLIHRLHFRNDLIFQHNHHSVTKIRHDEVTKKAEATQLSGCANYLKRCRMKFDLQNVDLLNLSKEGHDHKRWLQRHGI